MSEYPVKDLNDYPRKLRATEFPIKTLNPDFYNVPYTYVTKDAFIKRKERPKTFFEKFCESSSLHGIKYIVDRSIQPFERKIWGFVFILAVIVLFCLFLTVSFSQDCILTTYIENATYSVNDIAFPSLTICTSNRIDWSKIDKAETKFLRSNATLNQRLLFRNFIERFQGFRFGKFELFDDLRKADLQEIDYINIKEIIDFMTFECPQFFLSCKWIESPFNCCAVFKGQYTESGYCYTFNKEMSNSKITRPNILSNPNNMKNLFHASFGGAENGLSVILKMDPSRRSLRYQKNPDGVLADIHMPDEHPFPIIPIPVDSRVSLKLEPVYFTSEENVRKVKSDIRQCIFQDETDDPHYSTMPNFTYTYANCQSECRRQYTNKLCNCTLNIFHPLGNTRPCKPSDFYCLAKNDESLTYMKLFSEKNHIGIVCNCFRVCHFFRLHYTQTVLEDHLIDPPNHLRILAFYDTDHILRYKTFVSRNWFDYLVYYGSIVSFFIGCSVLSFVEIIYFFTIRFLTYIVRKENLK